MNINGGASSPRPIGRNDAPRDNTVAKAGSLDDCGNDGPAEPSKLPVPARRHRERWSIFLFRRPFCTDAVGLTVLLS